ncbi:MAG: dihydrolipoyl dehydrogenase [Chloroflexi bacterium]|nr:dihydrolipoyl dehydrogenase [Chloroflexota bacterium]
MTTAAREFDVIVIGTGSGVAIADSAAAEGLTAAIVESGPFGGTCVNRGCIPSKQLIHSADVMEIIDKAADFGIIAHVDAIDWDKIISRVISEADDSANTVESRYHGNDKVAIYKGEGRFVDFKTMEVNGERITAPKIMVAAGSRPVVPPIPGIDGVPYLTSDEALRYDKQPEKLIVVGGGFVGIELAHFYGALGTDVTIVQRGPTLLPIEDEDVARRFTDLAKRKYRVILDAETRSVSHNNGEISLEITTPSGDQTIIGDTLLLATGRRPNSDRLDLDKTGVQMNARGLVVVDEYLETNVPGIWALGDVVGRYQLKHNANWEWWHADHNMFDRGPKAAVNYHAMPHAVFASPQIGAVGMTEQQARDEGVPYVLGTYEYAWSAHGIAIGDLTGFVKIIAHAETREILGAHIMGTDAATLIQDIANGMRIGLTTDVYSQGIYVHPAAPEVVYRAMRSVPGTKFPPMQPNA